MTALATYLALFLAAFLAATIVPAQSEAVLVGLILADDQPVLPLLLVATAGNVLGSVVNWLLGRFIEHFRDRPWFPVSRPRLAQAETWYRRIGIWSLLLSWVPIIGDPLTVVAGILRTPFLTFLALVTLAKAGRYIVLAAATLQVAG
ncbi:MAG: DedA family protein [Alphaproteobacteria bacterium]|nr:DedA family protein [Alphaproteobacteria bacterium]